jgi:hypothetical protein
MSLRLLGPSASMRVSDQSFGNILMVSSCHHYIGVHGLSQHDESLWSSSTWLERGPCFDQEKALLKSSAKIRLE